MRKDLTDAALGPWSQIDHVGHVATSVGEWNPLGMPDHIGRNLFAGITRRVGFVVVTVTDNKCPRRTAGRSPGARWPLPIRDIRSSTRLRRGWRGTRYP